MATRITPMDIERQEFPRKMRGYEVEAVQMFLKSVAEEIGRVNLENAELLEEVGDLRMRVVAYGEREQALQQTLVTAQNMSGEMRDRARAEADLTVREARLVAERMLQQAQDQLARLESEMSRCKLERDLFERRLRAVIDEHLRLLEHRREEEPAPALASADNLHVLPPRAVADAG